MKESDIQKQIVEYLSLVALQNKKLAFFSIPNEGINMACRMAGMNNKQIAILTNHFKSIGMTPGVPDIWVGYSGKTYFIEVKKLGEKPSAIQKLIHSALQRCGFKTFVVYSVECVKEIILEILE